MTELSTRYWRLRDLWEPSPNRYQGYSRKRKLSGLSSYLGGRYSFLRLGDGWALVDRRPDDPGYRFEAGKRRLYAAKILEDTTHPDEAIRLFELAKKMDGPYQGLDRDPGENIL